MTREALAVLLGALNLPRRPLPPRSMAGGDDRQRAQQDRARARPRRATRRRDGFTRRMGVLVPSVATSTPRIGLGNRVMEQYRQVLRREPDHVGARQGLASVKAGTGL